MGPLPLRAIERWWLRAGVFLLPLVYTWDTYDRFVLPKLLLARFLIIGLLILVVARSILSGALTLRRTPLDLPILAFVASAAISTVFAFNQNVAVFGTYSRYDGLLTLLTYAGLFWLAVQALADRDEARILLRVLLTSGYLVAALAILQSVGDSVAQQTFVPAFGTLGQKNVLGMFLAMLSPLAFREVVEAESWSKRVLALNAFVVIVVALVLSLSRSAWLGATIAGVVLLLGSYRPNLRLVIAGISAVLVAGVLIAGLTIVAQHQLERRPDIWRDSLSLIASRPLFGYGPDNFGLVYPRFQTKELGTQQVDKAHAETVQVASTQGLIGLAAYGIILAAFVRAFWHRSAPTLPSPASGGGNILAPTVPAPASGGGNILAPTVPSPARGGGNILAPRLSPHPALPQRGRDNDSASGGGEFRPHPALPRERGRDNLAMFAAIAAYQVALQINFTALAAALPFWVVAAAAMELWGATRVITIPLGHRRVSALAGAVTIAALLTLAVVGVVRPYLADSRLLAAVQSDVAGRSDAARVPAAQARELAPQESVYAVEVGNIAFERGEWARAADAYLDAANLGTYNPLVYRNLALADRNLGRIGEARAAARKAFELDRFDPANRALVAQLEALSRNQTHQQSDL